jgi:hypothetical protein
MARLSRFTARIVPELPEEDGQRERGQRAFDSSRAALDALIHALKEFIQFFIDDRETILNNNFRALDMKFNDLVVAGLEPQKTIQRLSDGVRE